MKKQKLSVNLSFHLLQVTLRCPWLSKDRDEYLTIPIKRNIKGTKMVCVRTYKPLIS